MTLRTLLHRLLRTRRGAHRADKPMRLRVPKKILVLGGSNTLMREGYLPALLSGLAARFGAATQVTNLAAGANSSIHGLLLAKAVPDLATYDLVIVEYGVNDVKHARRTAMDILKGATEGLLRHLIAARPDRPVVFVHFLRRDMSATQFGPTKHLKRLVARYGKTSPVFLVDVDGMLRDQLFPTPEVFRSLYSDAGHFRRPVVAGLVGAYVAAEIALHLNRRRRLGGLPTPLVPWHFQNSRVIDVSASTDQEGSGRTFSNSRFRLQTRVLGIGEKMTVEIPGELVCIEFVIHRASATLRVSEEGHEPFAVHTCHRRIGRFPFLLKSQPLTWKPWSGLNGNGPRRVTLEALADASSDELRPQNNMVPGTPGQMEGVFLRQLLCLE